MSDKPSWHTSTLSQIALGSAISFEIACLVLIVGGGWYHKPDMILAGFNGTRWLAEALVIGYLARGQFPKNGDNQPPQNQTQPT